MGRVSRWDVTAEGKLGLSDQPSHRSAVETEAHKAEVLLGPPQFARAEAGLGPRIPVSCPHAPEGQRADAVWRCQAAPCPGVWVGSSAVGTRSPGQPLVGADDAWNQASPVAEPVDPHQGSVSTKTHTGTQRLLLTSAPSGPTLDQGSITVLPGGRGAVQGSHCIWCPWVGPTFRRPCKPSSLLGVGHWK
jgi:hypothetical protein